MKIKKYRKLINNFVYVIASNAVSVLVSILAVLIVPKFIGASSFGYWQLYLLYTTFVGFLHFGWNDGLYLRLGGVNYKDLDQKLYSSQFYLLLLSQSVLSAIFSLCVYNLGFDADKAYVLYMTAVCMVVVNVRYMLLFLLQATYRIKEYSVATVLDRFIYFLLIIALLVFEYEDYKFLVLVDIIGKAISLLLTVYYCKDIAFQCLRKVDWSFSVRDIVENIRVGSKLMLSNVSSKLVIGNVRFGIESVWSISVFGKVSLMLSVTNFVMIFIQSVSLVLFPFLRRAEKSVLLSVYQPLRGLLTLILLFFMLTYYPVSLGLKFWLPDYQDALKFLLILYPVIVFEGKMALLINTYLKVLRKETLLLKINSIALLLSLSLTFLTVYVFESIDMAVYSIFVLVVARSIIAEIYLQGIIDLNLIYDMALDVFFVLIFLLVNFLFEGGYGFLFSIALPFFYLIVKKKEFLSIFYLIKSNSYGKK